MPATTTQKRARIVPDESPESPRDWDNVGKFVGWHPRYTLGDEQPTEAPEDWLANLAAEYVNGDADLIPPEHVRRIIDKYFVLLSVFMFDHSGVALNTTGFSCPWDSGQVGYVYCTKERAVAESGSIEQAEKNMRSEIETYSQYINGEVFGFILEEGEPCSHGEIHWEHVDSCWGFYGLDPKQNGMLEHMTEEWAPVLLAAEEDF